MKSRHAPSKDKLHWDAFVLQKTKSLNDKVVQFAVCNPDVLEQEYTFDKWNKLVGEFKPKFKEGETKLVLGTWSGEVYGKQSGVTWRVCQFSCGSWVVAGTESYQVKAIKVVKVTDLPKGGDE